uniref:Uncharacterized protein LOC111109328 n=1 Tax=Crassostrea virginica TaxID=6565 RepID=A0A8B8BCH2_CRAVI|nr:uncharacterized protein LOC111109328 [Crassostrea virginica]
MVFSCGFCTKCFTKKKYLQRHLWKFHKIVQSVNCKYCDKTISEQDLQDHINCHHANKLYVCKFCQKTFTNKWNCGLHKRKCTLNPQNDITAQEVSATCSSPPEPSHHSSPSNLQHQPTERDRFEDSPRPGPSRATSPAAPSKIFHCRSCNSAFSNRRELYVHHMRYHYQTGRGGLQPLPYAHGQEPWTGDRTLEEVYETNRTLILQRHREGTVHSTYNTPLNNHFSTNDLMNVMDEIYDRQQHAFRLNLEFGLILRNIETGEYRYFRPFTNQSLFTRPLYVSRRPDLLKLRRRLETFNFEDHFLRQRPNTKWKAVLVTNVVFSLYHLSYTLGSAVHLPFFVTNSRSIVTLEKTRQGKPYDDNLCLFRCLATHYHLRKKLQIKTRLYFEKWMAYLKKHDHVVGHDENNVFSGVTLDQIPQFEKCFDINVNIFELTEKETALCIYKSRCQFNNSMHLNMYRHHLSYISNLQAYAKKYQCRTCERHFSCLWNMQRHQRNCSGKTVHQFPGGMYTSPKTIFEKLEEYDVHVLPEDRLFPWFLVYDFEALLVPVHGEKSEKLTWMAQHQPISVSVCSNVEGFETPHCIVDPHIDSLVQKMVEYMENIANRGEELARKKFDYVLKELEDMIKDPPTELCRISHNDRSDALTEGDESWEEDLFDGCDDAYRSQPSDSAADELVKKLIQLKEQFESYCKQMICLGFNSSKYDMNLVKSHLAKHLQMEKDNVFTVKRNNQYACLSNSTLKFLDITSYLSPGINYANFLKAYDVKENKGHFPYEWFDDLTKLERTSLPPHETFYSSLNKPTLPTRSTNFVSPSGRKIP